MERFGGKIDRRRQLRPLGGELSQGGPARTPRSQCHQGQKHLARNLGGAPDKPGAPGARFNLGGGKKLCYLLDYVEPRFDHRSLLSLVVDDNPMPSYHEFATATSPTNSKSYPLNFMPMGAAGPLCLQACAHSGHRLSVVAEEQAATAAPPDCPGARRPLSWYG